MLFLIWLAWIMACLWGSAFAFHYFNITPQDWYGFPAFVSCIIIAVAGSVVLSAVFHDRR